MLGVLADVESLAELVDDLLRNLSFVNSEQLNVLTAIKLNLKDADWLLFLLEVSNILRALGLALDLVRLRVSRAGCLLHRAIVSRICASVSRGSSLRLRVSLLIHHVPWSALCSHVSS